MCVWDANQRKMFNYKKIPLLTMRLRISKNHKAVTDNLCCRIYYSIS